MRLGEQKEAQKFHSKKEHQTLQLQRCGGGEGRGQKPQSLPFGNDASTSREGNSQIDSFGKKNNDRKKKKSRSYPDAMRRDARRRFPIKKRL